MSHLESFESKIDTCEIVQSSDLGEPEGMYKFSILFNDELMSMYISFDDEMLQYLNKIATGQKITQEDEEKSSKISIFF